MLGDRGLFQTHLAVTEFYTRDELLEEVAGLILREAPCLHNPVKELASCGVHAAVRQMQKKSAASTMHMHCGGQRQTILYAAFDVT